MIYTGRIQELKAIRPSADGLILGDEDGEVLLPSNEIVDPESDAISVFVYRDVGGRHLATTRLPKVEVGGFARLRMEGSDATGARMDWGTEPGLIVPFADQKKPLVHGKWYVVRVFLDEQSDRAFGSTQLEDFLSNDRLTVHRGNEVDLMVFGRSALGMSVIVNDRHQGLIHSNDLFRHISVGDRLTGYVKQVREDGKLDITLQPIGFRNYNDANVALLAKRLQSGSGFIPLNDKSEAEDIHAEFGISKKAFKKALGTLYKERLVRIEEAGIIWVG